MLLIAVVVNYLLHSGTEGLNPVAEAAERTAGLPGGRLKMDVTYSVDGSSTATGTGGGVFDSASGRARLALTVDGDGGDSIRTLAVSDKALVFSRSSALDSQLPPGKEWLAMEPLLGHDPSNALGADTSAEGSLEMLSASGEVEKVSEETVRGTPTTRYKSAVDLSTAADLFSEKGEASLAHEYREFAKKAPAPIPVEVWVDAAGLVRKWRIVEPVVTNDGSSVSMDMQMEIFDFGAYPGIKLPPESRVLDYTPVLRAELGMLDGTSLGPESPPAGKAPLSVRVFRQRAVGICEAFKAKALKSKAEEPDFGPVLKSMSPEEARSGAARPILNQVGIWLEDSFYPTVVHAISQLHGLAPPTRYAATYRRYLTIDTQQAEWVLADARANRLGSFKIPGDDHETEEARQRHELKDLAASMGIQACEKEVGGSSSQTA